MNNKFIIRTRCFLKGSIVGKIKMNMRIRSLGGSVSDAESTVEKYMPTMTTEQKQAIVRDMVHMAKRYHFGFDEYIYFHFHDKSLKDRLAFFPDILQRNVVRNFNKAYNQYIFDDKGSCAERFSKYYQRDYVVVYRTWPSYKSIMSDLYTFIKKHSRFIVKPLTSGCGNGVRIIDRTQYSNEQILARTLIAEFCKGLRGGFICEELIEQDERMAAFHPSSVNTIRLTTVRFPDRVEVIHSFMRTGQKGNVVDNGGAGGLFCTIDMPTGKVIASADEDGIFYTKHPDSGIDIVGFVIPYWEEAVKMAKELAIVVKGNRYTGWDLALSKDRGWVMVEGNAMGQFVGWQIPTQKGFRDELNKILNELHLKTYLAEE